MRRRSSLQITLALIGLVALSACSDEKRQVYRSKQDCIEDWGDGKGCEEAPAGSGHYRTGFWYGPLCRGSAYHGTRSISTVSASRGGFGRFGGFHSSFGG